MDTTDRSIHGAPEVNGLLDPKAYHNEMGDLKRSVDWTEPGLYVHRLRLLTDRGYPMWDVSYCHGTMPDGTYVRVRLPFHQLPRRGMKRALVEHAKRDGVYARGLGILDNISLLGHD